jgi:hypothetical protein
MLLRTMEVVEDRTYKGLQPDAGVKLSAPTNRNDLNNVPAPRKVASGKLIA